MERAARLRCPARSATHAGSALSLFRAPAALFGPADAHLTIGASDFSLKVNGKKELLPSQPWGLVAKGVKDLEWVSPIGLSLPPSRYTGIESP